jgi:transposase InsO family protein
VKFAFILAEKASYPIAWLCSALAVSRSGYYAWRQRKEPRRRAQDRRLGVEVEAIFCGHFHAYGSPRIHRELAARGVPVSRKRVERLLRERGLSAQRRKRSQRTTDSNHPHPIAGNLLARRFTAEAPNQAWVGDITYLWTAQGWLYLAILLDLFSRRIVGWTVSPRLDLALALEPLEQAITARRPAPGLIVHHDRGVQYAAHAYRERLRREASQLSMSRKGNCWDNAVAESFFASLKRELVSKVRWSNLEEATRQVHHYIENYYNRQRRHSSLGYISPVEFELRDQAKRMG